jgi:hypothetical protein
MAASLLERVPVDGITAQARQVRFWRTVGSALAWLLLALGFVTARLLSTLWLGAAWCAVAVRAGWREGRSPEWAASAERRQDQRRIRAGRTGPR